MEHAILAKSTRFLSNHLVEMVQWNVVSQLAAEKIEKRLTEKVFVYNVVKVMLLPVVENSVLMQKPGPMILYGLKIQSQKCQQLQLVKMILSALHSKERCLKWDFGFVRNVLFTLNKYSKIL